jgi:GNAT superfamily N-acetyltransferase
MAKYLVHELREERLVEDILEILASAYMTNPMHEAVFKGSPEERRKGNRELFRMGIADRKDGYWLYIRKNSIVTGVLHYSFSPSCSHHSVNREEMDRIMKEKLGEASSRIALWRKEWENAHIKESHCHLGPIAVTPDYQNRGMGAQLMGEYCHRMDAVGATGYLETDVPRNLPFYRKFGFREIGSSEVLGVPCWFMIRDPKDFNSFTSCS